VAIISIPSFGKEEFISNWDEGAMLTEQSAKGNDFCTIFSISLTNWEFEGFDMMPIAVQVVDLHHLENFEKIQPLMSK